METEDNPAPTVAASPIRQSDPQVKNLTAALVKAQAAMSPAKKSGANPHYKSAYATLADTHQAVCGPLAEYGLGYIQAPTAEGAEVSVTTRIIHDSGEWLEVTTTAFAKGSKIQDIGSTITYLRRYGLQGLTGLTAGDDDDGETGMGRGAHDGHPVGGQRRPRPAYVEKRSEEQIQAEQWEEGRVDFCSTLSALGFGYEEICLWLSRKPDHRRPSAMTRSERERLLDHVSKSDNKDSIRDEIAALSLHLEEA